LLGVVAGDTTSPDLGAVAHEATKQVDVFVVDVVDVLGREDRDLLLATATVVTGLCVTGGLASH